jgi:uncharacterized Zn finger protein (UPF0148 family)
VTGPRTPNTSPEERLEQIEAVATGEPLSTAHPIVGGYVDGFRRQHQQGKLPRGFAKRLRAAGVALDSAKQRSPEERLEELAEFCDVYGRLPKPSDDKSLNRWLKDVRQRLKQGYYDAEFRRRFASLMKRYDVRPDPYRERVLAGVKRRKANFVGAVPTNIEQSTRLNLKCVNGNSWQPQATQLVKKPIGNCSCPECGQRRAWRRDAVRAAAEELGLVLRKARASYRASDRVELDCAVCGKNPRDVAGRTFRTWVSDGAPACPYCETEEVLREWARGVDREGSLSVDESPPLDPAIRERARELRRWYDRGTMPANLVKLIKRYGLDLE